MSFWLIAGGHSIFLELKFILVPARNCRRVFWNRRSVKAGGGSDRQQEQRRGRCKRECFSAACSLVGPRWRHSAERNQRVFCHRLTPLRITHPNRHFPRSGRFPFPDRCFSPKLPVGFVENSLLLNWAVSTIRFNRYRYVTPTLGRSILLID